MPTFWIFSMSKLSQLFFQNRKQIRLKFSSCEIIPLFILTQFRKKSASQRRFSKFWMKIPERGRLESARELIILKEELFKLVNDRESQNEEAFAPWIKIILNKDVWLYCLAWFCACFNLAVFTIFPQRYYQLFLWTSPLTGLKTKY